MNSDEKLEIHFRIASLEEKMVEINQTVCRLESELQASLAGEEDETLKNIQLANFESLISMQKKMLAHVTELYQQAIDASRREA